MKTYEQNENWGIKMGTRSLEQRNVQPHLTSHIQLLHQCVAIAMQIFPPHIKNMGIKKTYEENENWGIKMGTRSLKRRNFKPYLTRLDSTTSSTGLYSHTPQLFIETEEIEKKWNGGCGKEFRTRAGV